MEARGVVLSTDNNKAVVTISRNTACENCGACHFDEKTLNMQVTAINDINAKVGDKVYLSMDNVNFFQASFLLYGFPLIAMILGVSLGYYFLGKMGINNYDVYSILIGLLFMGLSYLILKKNEKIFNKNKKYMSIITEVIKDNEFFVIN